MSASDLRPMSCKQRQKSMHTCPLYSYTNNTSVKLNKTFRACDASIEKERGTGPLMRIYCWTQRESINSQQLHGPVAGASTMWPLIA